MTRLTIIIEDYDSSKIARSSLFMDIEKVKVARSLLRDSGTNFSEQEVSGELFELRIDDNNQYADLSLRTVEEVREWIDSEVFEPEVKSFLRSGNQSLHIPLAGEGSYLYIGRCETFNPM